MNLGIKFNNFSLLSKHLNFFHRDWLDGGLSGLHLTLMSSTRTNSRIFQHFRTILHLLPYSLSDSMKLQITSIVLFILFAQFVKAQKSFEPGYLLISPTDTVKGFIDYRNWSNNPETISFKTSEQEQAKTYGFADLAGFYVHGENYVKAEVDVDISPSSVDELSHSPSPQIKKMIAFLLIVNRGSKSLYYLRTKNSKVHLYISDQPGSYQLLINYRYLSGTNQIVSASQYKDQLKKFFSNCEGLIPDRITFSLSTNAISKIFDRFYEKCSSEKPAASYEREPIVIELGLLAGLSASKLRFKGTYTPDIINSNFPPSYNASGGLFLNWMLPRLRQRFSLYNELGFTSYKSSTSTQTDYSENSYNRYTNTFGYGYIKLTNMIRFYIPTGDLKLFVNAGMTNAVAISETNEQVTESKFYTVEPVISKDIVLGATKKYEIGASLGLGASYKKWGAELRHESSNGMSALLDLKSSVKRYYLLLSYRFK